MTVLDKPEQIRKMRIFMIIQGLELYLDTGMKVTRIATPGNLRMWATEYTGVPYKRSRQGLENALLDLRSIYRQATI